MAGTLSVSTLVINKPQSVTVVEDGKHVTLWIAEGDFASIPAGSERSITFTNAAVLPSTSEQQNSPTTGETNAKETGTSSMDPNGPSVNISASSGLSGDTSTGNIATQKTTTAPESTATETPATPPEGLSDGAFAGVAIACVIAGLAIGLVIAFIFFRRRRESVSSSPGFVELEERHAESKNGPQVNVISSEHDVELGQFLLDATPDKEIQEELCSLSELVYQHVETYYYEPQVMASSAEVAQCLVHIGYSSKLSGLQAEVVVAMCLAPKTSRVGLRHVLSHIIFRSLDFNSGGSLSMLPSVVAAMAQEKNTSEISDSPAISFARSRWRSLSALLLHPNPSERTPLPLSTEEASSRAHYLANELNSFLQLFVAQDSASRQDQTNHLQAVILECTRLGYVLLSQPGDWRFIFNSKVTPMDRTLGIVVCPGLERLSHNNGARYGSPKEVAAAETMPL